MKKSIIAAGAIATIGIAGLTGVAAANAESASSSSSTNPMSSLVDALASKFNLNKTDVQAVFDAQKTKMHEERETTVKAEVAKLVTDGKITQAQADKINAKRAELQKEREANKDSADSKTKEERQAETSTKKTELETWAKENDISTEYLRYVMGGGPAHSHGPRGDDTGNADQS